MSGTPKPESAAQSADDPSMEDILASIRRILSEEEAQPDTSRAAQQVASDDVLVLDSSMMVPEPHDADSHPAPPTPPVPAPASVLVAPAAAAAAASSVGNLVRTLAADRATQVYSGGPTIEDLVRAELRPLMKEWLDTNLPPLVERLVRAEIERVVGRAVP
ncbi:MAG TPA: DUF2497 domain-containing protein [Acetobacteraceae bacterium]|nr:DUF2497 domain-containing protein [Acetobacteraceae bacterium]